MLCHEKPGKTTGMPKEASVDSVAEGSVGAVTERLVVLVMPELWQIRVACGFELLGGPSNSCGFAKPQAAMTFLISRRNYTVL